jgi:hypothetical protein
MDKAFVQCPLKIVPLTTRDFWFSSTDICSAITGVPLLLRILVPPKSMKSLRPVNTALVSS